MASGETTVRRAAAHPRHQHQIGTFVFSGALAPGTGTFHFQTLVLYRMATDVADENFWAEEIFRAMTLAAPSHIAADISREAGLP
jgi:hypothetical protein